METILLLVSKNKNIEILDKLTNDPAFVVSLMKIKGLKECPDSLNIKIGISKPKREEKNEETKD